MEQTRKKNGPPEYQVIDLEKIKVSCTSCSLSELCLPRGMGKSALAKLEKIVKRASPLQKGEYLFRGGDPFNGIYAVRSGLLKVYANSDSGDEQIIGFYLPGEILGLDAIENEMHTCFAVTLETSSYCMIPFADLSDICKEIPELQIQVFKIMSRELTNENRMLLTLGKKNAEEKVATFILTISSRYALLGYSPNDFKLTMSRQEIGNYLGVTFETVSRIISRFQRDGIIEINKKFVHVRDMDALKQIISVCSG